MSLVDSQFTVKTMNNAVRDSTVKTAMDIVTHVLLYARETRQTEMNVQNKDAKVTIEIKLNKKN